MSSLGTNSDFTSVILLMEDAIECIKSKMSFYSDSIINATMENKQVLFIIDCDECTDVQSGKVRKPIFECAKLLRYGGVKVFGLTTEG